MSQLTEKNQRFGTVDLVIMVGLLAVVVSISQAIVGEVCADHRRLEARMKAESLAFRLAATDSLKDGPMKMKKPDLVAPAARGIASVNDVLAQDRVEGQIGQDPWGHPYRYSLKKDSLGLISEVSVWSAGSELEHPIRYVYTAPLQSRNRLVHPVSN